MNIQLLIILALALATLPGSIFINPPDLDPECVSDWSGLWSFDESYFCNAQKPYGHYELYLCEIEKWSDFKQEWYRTAKVTSTCLYTKELEVPEIQTFIYTIPYISTCIADPETKLCPRISWIRP